MGCGRGMEREGTLCDAAVPKAYLLGLLGGIRISRLPVPASTAGMDRWMPLSLLQAPLSQDLADR